MNPWFVFVAGLLIGVVIGVGILAIATMAKD